MSEGREGEARGGPVERYVEPRAWTLYRWGVLMHLGNPKSVLAWVAIMSLGLKPDAALGTVAVAYDRHALGEQPDTIAKRDIPVDVAKNFARVLQPVTPNVAGRQCPHVEPGLSGAGNETIREPIVFVVGQEELGAVDIADRQVMLNALGANDDRSGVRSGVARPACAVSTRVNSRANVTNDSVPGARQRVDLSRVTGRRVLVHGVDC
jgi:hypothetical protein